MYSMFALLRPRVNMNKLSVPLGGVTHTNHKHTTVHCKLGCQVTSLWSNTKNIKMLFKGTFKIVLCVLKGNVNTRKTLFSNKHCCMLIHTKTSIKNAYKFYIFCVEHKVLENVGHICLSSQSGE